MQFKILSGFLLATFLFDACYTQAPIGLQNNLVTRWNTQPPISQQNSQNMGVKPNHPPSQGMKPNQQQQKMMSNPPQSDMMPNRPHPTIRPNHPQSEDMNNKNFNMDEKFKSRPHNGNKRKPVWRPQHDEQFMKKRHGQVRSLLKEKEFDGEFIRPKLLGEDSMQRRKQYILSGQQSNSGSSPSLRSYSKSCSGSDSGSQSNSEQIPSLRSNSRSGSRSDSMSSYSEQSSLSLSLQQSQTQEIKIFADQIIEKPRVVPTQFIELTPIQN